MNYELKLSLGTLVVLAIAPLAIACGSTPEGETRAAERDVGVVSQALPKAPPQGTVCQVQGQTQVGTMDANNCCWWNQGRTVYTCYDCAQVACVPATVSRGAPLSLTNPGDQSSWLNAGVSRGIWVDGGTPPLGWWAAGLPSGLWIDANGVVNGAATAPGTSSVTVTAMDSSVPPQSSSVTFAWTVMGGTVCYPYDGRACCGYSRCSCLGDQYCNSTGTAWGPCLGSTKAGYECQ